MLKQFKEPVVMRGTDDPHFTMVSIQGKRKDEKDRPVWTEQLSVIDWCNRYHNPEHNPDDPDFNNLEETKVVPAEIVLRFRKRSAASVPEQVKNAATRRFSNLNKLKPNFLLRSTPVLLWP
jgi:hypothetical protein